MLKVLVRTLIILLAAAIITAGTVLFVNNGGMNSLGSIAAAEGMRGGFPGEHADRQGRLPPAGARPAEGGQRGFGQHGMEGGAGFSLAGLSGVGLQLGKVALITAVIVGAQAVFGLLRRKAKPAGTPAASTPGA